MTNEKLISCKMETFKVNNTEQISCAQNSTTSFLHFPARSHTVVVFRKAFEKQNAHMESGNAYFKQKVSASALLGR